MPHIITQDPWPHIISTGLLDREVLDPFVELEGRVQYGLAYPAHRADETYGRTKFHFHMDGNLKKIPIDSNTYPLDEIVPEPIIRQMWEQAEYNVFDNFKLLNPDDTKGFTSISIEYVREHGGSVGPISKNTANRIENIVMIQAGAGMDLASPNNGFQLWEDDKSYVRDIQWVFGRTVSFTAVENETFWRMPTTDIDGNHAEYASTKYLNIALR